ncbi:MAG TPA: hypothetical protein VGR34_06430 [Candidatus Dormibacteraeota bacterium]|nr:hypothetical protein [Candidatus Dormibacteraeota bacterium]
MKISCFATGCPIPALHELLGLRACTPHYIEALEHSAHIVTRPAGQLLQEERLNDDQRRTAIMFALAKRLRKKEAEEADVTPARLGGLFEN